MSNPETGIPQLYQELWTSESADDVAQQDPPEDPGAPVRDESAPNHPAASEPGVKVTVALLHRPQPPHLPTRRGPEVQGMIIRIGNYCQGIIAVPPPSTSCSSNDASTRDESRAENSFVRVERWRFQPTKDSSLSATGTGEIVEAEAQTGRRAQGEDAVIGKWVRDARSDYTEDPGRGIWMPCAWVCEQERMVGDSTEKDGFIATWRVVEAEG